MPFWDESNRGKLITNLLNLTGFPHADIPTVDEKQVGAGTETKDGVRVNTNAPPSTPETQTSSTAQANLRINTNAPPPTPPVVPSSYSSTNTHSPDSRTYFTPIMGGDDEMVTGDSFEPLTAKLIRENETRLYELLSKDQKTVLASFYSEILDLDKNPPWLEYVMSQMQRETGHFYQLESGRLDDILRGLRKYALQEDKLGLRAEEPELEKINDASSKTLSPVREDSSRSSSQNTTPSPVGSEGRSILSFLQSMSRSGSPSSHSASSTPTKGVDKEIDSDKKKENRNSPK